MFVCMLHTHADNILSVNDVTVVRGHDSQFDINLVNSDGITAFQFDLTLPVGVTFKSVEGTNRLVSTHTIGNKTTGQVTRFTLLSISNDLIEGESGTAVLKITVRTQEDVALGNFTASISGMELTRPDLVKFKPDAFDFTMTVSNRIILDEMSTTIPETASNVDLLVKRSLSANTWSTICLPFSMSEAQVKAAFGNNVRLGEFTGTEPEYANDEDEYPQSIQVNFEDASAIEANHPYIIMVSSDVTEFTVDGVDVDPIEDDACIEFDNGKTGKKRIVYSGFYGTYKANTEIEEECLFLSKNKFWYSKGLTKMKAFRAYFSFYDILESYYDTPNNTQGAKAVINFSTDPTGIKNVEQRNKHLEGIYNLNGQKLKEVQKGIVIQDGKKIVVM